MDYYETLGVRPDATDAEIKRAYRTLVKDAHPDSGDPGDVERFREIQKAYEALSGQSGAATGASPVSWTGGFDEPLTPFREVRPRASRTEAHLDIVLSPDEARQGGRVVLEAPHARGCDACAGRGLDFFGWCGVCRGEGVLETRERVTFQLRPGARHGDTVTARASTGRAVRARIRIR